MRNGQFIQMILLLYNANSSSRCDS